MTITETKIAFVYAGHTFRINLETDEFGNEFFDLIPVSSVPLDERGTYPANHALCEADELLNNKLGFGKESALEDLTNTVAFLIRSGEFEAVK